MRSFLHTWLFALAGLLLAVPCLMAAPQELKRLRVLIALSGSELKNSMDIDEERLVHLLRSNIPHERLKVVPLRGAGATREAILSHYKGLRVSPDEALLFYYTGRCSTDPKPA